ncbi:hypothetical protein DENSPDRAFT_455798 [Dentipellis sp. KUC8613]|nr:hypothetical protein DENSPDRAFT_455798 [Dentipellis sp. KUC8613]
MEARDLVSASSAPWSCGMHIVQRLQPVLRVGVDGQVTGFGGSNIRVRCVLKHIHEHCCLAEALYRAFIRERWALASLTRFHADGLVHLDPSPRVNRVDPVIGWMVVCRASACSKTFAGEVRILLQKGGKLRGERRALQRNLADVMAPSRSIAQQGNRPRTGVPRQVSSYLCVQSMSRYTPTSAGASRCPPRHELEVIDGPATPAWSA